MYTRIVVPLDGSRLAEQILPYARLIAMGFGIPIKLLRIVQSLESSLADLAEINNLPEAVRSELKSSGDIDRRGVSRRSEVNIYLAAVEDSLKEAGVVEVSSEVQQGSSAECILKVADAEPTSLIAISSHGRSGITRWLLGSTVDKVLKASKNPLLIVRPKDNEAARTTAQFSTIVVPLDGSPLAEQSLPHAVALAKTLALKVILARVVPFPGQYYFDTAYPLVPLGDFDKQVEESALNYLHQIGQNLSDEGIGTVEERLLRGYPASGIVDLARESQNSLVAMTTHGRSGIGRWLLGSVADRVVQHSGDPVLVIRAKEEASQEYHA